MKYTISTLALSAVSCLLLVGCGGGSDSTDADNEADQVNTTTGNDASNNDDVLTGIFVDSAVEGVSYTTESQSGTTNAAGEFSYLAGESVTFSIGDLQFPTVVAKDQISPVDLAAISNDPDSSTTNIARLLQTLDSDGNPDNGIVIPAQATDSAAQFDFDVNVTDFENDSTVINLVANSGSINTSLISWTDALEHLGDTLGVDIPTPVEFVAVDTSENTSVEDITEISVFSKKLDIEVSKSSNFIRNEELTFTISSTNGGQLYSVIRDGEEFIRVSAGTCITHGILEVPDLLEGIDPEITDTRGWGFFSHDLEVVGEGSVVFHPAGNLEENEYQLEGDANSVSANGTYQVCYDTTVDIIALSFSLYDQETIRYFGYINK